MPQLPKDGYTRVSYDDESHRDAEEEEHSRTSLDDSDSAHTLVGPSMEDLTLVNSADPAEDALLKGLEGQQFDRDNHLLQPKIVRRKWCLGVLGVALLVVLAVPVCLFRHEASSVATKVSELADYLESNNTAVIDDAMSSLHKQGWTTFDTSSSKPFQARRRPVRMLRSQQDMTQACAQQWIAEGTLCGPVVEGNRPSLVDSEIDIVWTWVAENAHWSAWRKRLANNPKWGMMMRAVHGTPARVAGMSEKQFRSHDQLRFSQRSALAALPSVRKVHLVANDLPMCDAADTSCSNIGSPRVGQIPLWLDIKKLGKQAKYNLQHHWNLFRADDEDAPVWRASSLPVFDSLAIESQLPNVDDIAESFLYMNDDLYILRPLTSADISTPLLGPVFRIQKDLLVHGEKPGAPSYSSGGEWPSMNYANYLLDQRFGKRARSYLVHESKTVSSPLLDEVASVWAEELKATAGVRFRGRGAEVNMLFLATYYVIERHREALLWSFFVGKMDNSVNGRYSAQDRQDLLAALDGESAMEPGQNGTVKVSRPSRDPLTSQQANDLLKSANLSPPNQTSYTFSSANGYALADLKQPPSSWPDFDTSRDTHIHPSTVCSMNLTTCFGGLDFGSDKYKGDSSATSLFKRMAFANPECGDCAILALLGKSGKKGLEAFLPPAVAASQEEQTGSNPPNIAPPMLGDLHNEWKYADMSVSSVIRDGWSRRDYAVRLIQRYSYVIGDTSSRFFSIHAPLSLLRDLKYLEKSLDEADGPTFVALNDDIARARDVPTVDANLGLWHNKMWSEKMEYEL